MKRIFALTLAMALLLCGCGKSADNTDQSGNAATIQLGDVTLTVGAAFTDEQKTALGEPAEVTESPNCVHDGAVYEYHYDGFILQVNEQSEGKNVLLAVTIEDAAYSTAKGIKVGDTADAVAEAYGDAAEETKYYAVYDLTEEVTLTFQLKDGTVSTILYDLKV